MIHHALAKILGWANLQMIHHVLTKTLGWANLQMIALVKTIFYQTME
jgi:hypothetical protein